jgi:hypothetical protein
VATHRAAQQCWLSPFSSWAPSPGWAVAWSAPSFLYPSGCLRDGPQCHPTVALGKPGFSEEMALNHPGTQVTGVQSVALHPITGPGAQKPPVWCYLNCGYKPGPESAFQNFLSQLLQCSQGEGVLGVLPQGQAESGVDCPGPHGAPCWGVGGPSIRGPPGAGPPSLWELTRGPGHAGGRSKGARSALGLLTGLASVCLSPAVLQEAEAAHPREDSVEVLCAAVQRRGAHALAPCHAQRYAPRGRPGTPGPQEQPCEEAGPLCAPHPGGWPATVHTPAPCQGPPGAT